MFAMTLHEKGRAALKRKEHGEALLLLMDAESEFELVTQGNNLHPFILFIRYVWRNSVIHDDLDMWDVLCQQVDCLFCL